MNDYCSKDQNGDKNWCLNFEMDGKLPRVVLTTEVSSATLIPCASFLHILVQNEYFLEENFQAPCILKKGQKSVWKLLHFWNLNYLRDMDIIMIILYSAHVCVWMVVRLHFLISRTRSLNLKIAGYFCEHGKCMYLTFVDTHL